MSDERWIQLPRDQVLVLPEDAENPDPSQWIQLDPERVRVVWTAEGQDVFATGGDE